ncbi:MAG: hypothetical protein EAZ47_01700 [Bacteroidetes bacterium]|nr:MAG: hypothetical protein EAY72_02365 [Bacteroidota bacterium]TAE66718.1 MAG: hypothetical protein EAY68_05870 [Bacteroidota bacterium]TAF97473.1 MAG: hypothetical protein EAZ47_01700 [Bacteroidota bacterium]
MAMVFWQILFQCVVATHPLYVSMTQIIYQPTDKTIEVSVRIFTDDFEETLRKTNSGKINLTIQPHRAENDSLVKRYLLQHLQVNVENTHTPLALQYVGYEEQAESIWVYFEVKNVGPFKRLRVKNSVLHDFRNDQINLLQIKNGEKEQSFKLDYPNSTALFSF